jgi:hypothetical protein
MKKKNIVLRFEEWRNVLINIIHIIFLNLINNLQLLAYFSKGLGNDGLR